MFSKSDHSFCVAGSGLAALLLTQLVRATCTSYRATVASRNIAIAAYSTKGGYDRSNSANDVVSH